MSVSQINAFVKKVSTASDAAGNESPIAKYFEGLKGLTGDAKMQAVQKKIAEAAKAEGFDVSEEDVKKYTDSLATQYEVNPSVASMLDIYCTTTCHLGTAVGK